MGDNKSKRHFRDRNRVSADDEHEVEYFARQNRISPDLVRELIETHGNDRASLTKAAKALRELKLTPHQQPRRG